VKYAQAATKNIADSLAIILRKGVKIDALPRQTKKMGR
jgi:hypothetical protein